MFFIEYVNTLTGTRQQWRASPYASLDAAKASAKDHAARSRSFATYNVLDAKGATVASYQGVA